MWCVGDVMDKSWVGGVGGTSSRLCMRVLELGRGTRIQQCVYARCEFYSRFGLGFPCRRSENNTVEIQYLMNTGNSFTQRWRCHSPDERLDPRRHSK